MWCYGKGNSGGLWLPEEKTANLWHGRGNSGGSWPPAFPRSRDWNRKKPAFKMLPTYILSSWSSIAVPYFHDLDNHYNQSNIVFSNLLFSFLYRKLFKTFSYFKFNKVPYSRYFFYLADFYINKYKNRCKKAKHRLARLLICSI